ncbi:DUF454 family protein [Mixta intestinalis]|uniref:Inner membrane protein n=1 Tax=Mixta intestinalis TaxID=1615494 RepID=A0A6P1PVT6_9GAMM|nr:DUF454 family protein [Mixta intestinalis]QHM70172.1 Inner membrane protein YbaN [Mixta intestinalis]
MRRIILLTIGWLAILLGSLGVVLPLLPTTPFILLAAWCFARSSPRFHHWLLWRSWFGSYIRHWQQHRALPPGVKGRAILLIVCTFTFSVWMVEVFWLRIMLLVMLGALLIMMWRMPVVTEQNPKESASGD